MFDLGFSANFFAWTIFEKCYAHNIFATLQQQNLGSKCKVVISNYVLLALISCQIWLYSVNLFPICLWDLM